MKRGWMVDGGGGGRRRRTRTHSLAALLPTSLVCTAPRSDPHPKPARNKVSSDAQMRERWREGERERGWEREEKAPSAQKRPLRCGDEGVNGEISPPGSRR